MDTQQPVNIHKIHFLIHPGFLSYEVPKMDGDVGSVNPYALRMDEYNGLLDKYLTEAKTLKDDELMMAFAHTTRKQMVKDAKNEELYMVTLRELKNILGKRLIVLSGNFDVVNEDGVFDVAKKIAHERGYYFDNTVITEAYGEMLSICVERGADRMNRNAELQNKTLIRPSLTDTPVYTPLEKLQEEMIEKHENIRYK